MNALKINGYVGKDGLKIGIEKLKMFENKKVEIIIIPETENSRPKDKSLFFDAIGKIDIDKNEIQSLRELSKI